MPLDLAQLNVLDAGTLVPIGVIVVVAAVLIPLMIKLIRELTQTRSLLRKVWTVEHQAVWANEQRERNPELKQPDAYAVAAKLREINASDSEAA